MHDQARRLGAALRDAEEQSHVQLANAILVEHFDATGPRHVRGFDARGEFTRREHVARLIRQLARKVRGVGR